MSVSVYSGETGSMITSRTFTPGSNGELQKLITDLMHRLVMERGEFTLAELGYYHANSITFDANASMLHFRVYFNANYVYRQKVAPNGRKILVPVNELNVFKNYLFAGDLENVVTLDKMMMPKSKNIIDDMKRPAIVFKDRDKYVETAVMIMEANLSLAMAAALDINIMDENFSVKCNTVAKGAKNDNMVKTIITNANRPEYPVNVTVTYGTENGYDPEDAVPYLTMLSERLSQINEGKSKLKGKIADKSKKKAKEKTKSGSFGKFC